MGYCLAEISFGLQIATFVIVFATAVFGIARWLKRKGVEREYKKLMDNPLEVNFLIPLEKKCKIYYSKQDNVKEGLEKSITLPVHDFGDQIFIHIIPKLTLKVTHRYFGIESGDEGEKPDITYFNPFIKAGTDSLHWKKDWHGYYHIEDEAIWLKDEKYLPAFKINTFEKGTYSLNVVVHVTSYEWKGIRKEINKVITKTLEIKVE